MEGKVGRFEKSITNNEPQKNKKNGFISHTNHQKMSPFDSHLHISTSGPYTDSPNNNSGGRYHNVITVCVMAFNGI